MNESYKCLISQPNRYHKNLLPQLQNKKDVYCYHETIKLLKPSQYKSKNNLLNIVPFNYPKINVKQKIYGVFPAARFDYLKSIKKYTIIENPVDRVYQMFAYYEFQIKHLGTNNQQAFSNAKINLDNFINMHITNPNNVNININVNDVNYVFVKDALNQFNNLNTFEFVGTVEKIEKSINIINGLLKTDIKYETKMQRIPLYYQNYRRNELEDALFKQLEEYEKINNFI